MLFSSVISESSKNIIDISFLLNENNNFIIILLLIIILLFYAKTMRCWFIFPYQLLASGCYKALFQEIGYFLDLLPITCAPREWYLGYRR